MKPDFTETEKLVIASIKSRSSWSTIYSGLLTIFVALIFAGLAYYGADYMWLIGSFVILVSHIMQNVFAMKTYAPVYRAIFDKYDAAIKELTSDHNQNLQE